MSNESELHKVKLTGHQYWACSEPESPPRDGIWWDENCLGCILAYKSAIVNGYGRKIVVYDPDKRFSPIEMEEAPIENWKELKMCDG